MCDYLGFKDIEHRLLRILAPELIVQLICFCKLHFHKYNYFSYSFHCMPPLYFCNKMVK